MKMKLITFGVAALMAGSIGIAYATPNMVQNGDFSQTSSTPGHAKQFGADYGGNFVSNWQADGYTIWYPDSDSALLSQGGCGETQYHSGTSGNCSTLNAVGTPVPGAHGTFIAMDGLAGSLRGSIQQQLGGLTTGALYNISFYWGTSQETQASNPLPTNNQYLQVWLGGNSQNTNTVTTALGDFDGWFHTTMQFTAQSTNDLLTFVSFGLPTGAPPMILLTDVSVTRRVPEPPALALFGGGLLGLGLLTVFARRRALRHGVAGDDMG